MKSEVELNLLPPILENNTSDNKISFLAPGLPSTFKITPSQLFLVETENYYLSEKTFKEEIQQITAYLSEFKKPKIVTPFKGTSLAISKDKSKFFFGSREGRIGVARIDTKETIGDVDLKEGTIWTIALSHNDKYLYSGGQGGQIKKFLVETMTQLCVYDAHTDEVNVILISKDETKMYSTGDDGKVIMWELNCENGKPKILYQINKICYGLDLSADNHLIATVGGDRMVHVYDLEIGEKVKTLAETDFGVTWCVTITYNNTYLAFGDDRAVTFLYNMKSWERARVFRGHKSRVRCMSSTMDEKYLITGGIDNLIFVWDLNEDRNGIEMCGHTDWVKAFIIAEDQKTFYSMSDDCSIQTWRIPKYDNYYILKNELYLSEYLDIYSCHRSSENLFLIKKNGITKFDRSDELKETKIDFEAKHVSLFCINPKDDKIVTVRKETQANAYSYQDTSKKYIFEFYDSNFEKLREKSLEFYKLAEMIYSADGNYLILGELYKCVIVHESTMDIYHEFRSHKGTVVNLACSPNMKYVFSFDDDSQNKMIKSYNFFKKIELKALIDPTLTKLKKMKISADEDYLVVMSKDYFTTIWATSKMIKIIDLRLENCRDLMFNNNYNHLYCLFSDNIRIYTLPSMCVNSIIKFRTESRFFTFNYDYSEIIIGLEKSIEVWKTPTGVLSLALYGENKILYEFYKYMANIVSGKEVKYEKEFNSWIIEPFHMNIMHIYAYFSKIEFLNKAIEDGAGFIVSRSGNSPLDVCFEMNNEAGIYFFYKYIMKTCKDQPYFSCVLGKSLNRICRHQSYRTKKLLDLMLIKSIDSSLTRFHHSTVQLPIIVFSPTLFTDKNSYLKKNFSNEGQALEFLQTYFKLNLLPGSQESLELIKSLIETENDQIFMSNFIQTILQQKWTSVRYILYVQAVVFIVYLVLLSIYSSVGNISVLSACFAINLILIVYEFIQFLCSRQDYFKDLWNYIDITRSSLMVLIWIRDIAGVFNPNDNLIALVVFISWTRGISYFRVIKVTRYYINLIYEVIWDILPFLSILFYSTIAFSFVFERLQHRSDSYFKYLTSSWEINVGGFDSTTYDDWMYLSFFVHTILNPILMLNLLISIMSHTFDRVNSNILVADSRELAGMILEGELVYTWRRKYNESSFLHVCKSLEITVQENEMKKLRNRVNLLGDIMSKTNADMEILKTGQIEIKHLLEQLKNSKNN